MSRMSPFTRIDLSYRTLNDVPLKATILIPNSILAVGHCQNRKHPVMVRWHGGGFVVGHRMYEPWFAQWLLDMALDHEAIIVTADYRLLPESNGSDILGDVAQFWDWLQRTLPQYFEQNSLPGIDISNILCCGESSGGFISVYCALHLSCMLQPEVDVHSSGNLGTGGNMLRIRAVISISAPLDATAPEYKIPRPRIFMGQKPPPPREALGKIRAYIKGIPKGSIRTGCEPTSEMWQLLLCIAQQAYLPRLFGMGIGKSKSTLEGLLETLERGEHRMVPVWIVHGKCPAACSSGFAARLRETQPNVPVHLTLHPGEHLFDVDMRGDVDWVREGRHFLEEHWPQPGGKEESTSAS
ncbi:putative polyketide synthase [Aspergillus stella-maris]|uniref:putative polyketide synthase n=1 Tax=Aspergillus stella-maris TaxID=1810926 RepID=UPI003CCD1BFE